MLRAFLFGGTSVAVMALLPLVARHMVAGGPLTYGVLLGVFGVGAIGGALLSTRLRETAVERVDRAAGLRRLRGLRRAAGDRRPRRGSAAIGMLIGGACWVLALSLFNATVQLSAPRWVLGRALALYQTAAFGGMALGSWLWGAVAEAHGLSQALLAAAGAMLAAGAGRAAAAAARPRRPQPRPAEPLRRAVAGARPEAAQRADPHRGRVPHRTRRTSPTFLEAMAERQRIRLRDGARGLDAASATSRTPSSGSRATRRRPGSTMSATTSAAPRPTPTPSTGSAALHAGPDPPRVRRRIVRQARWTGDEPMPKPPIDHH